MSQQLLVQIFRNLGAVHFVEVSGHPLQGLDGLIFRVWVLFEKGGPVRRAAAPSADAGKSSARAELIEGSSEVPDPSGEGGWTAGG